MTHFLKFQIEHYQGLANNATCPQRKEEYQSMVWVFTKKLRENGNEDKRTTLPFCHSNNVQFAGSFFSLN
jgi:hypothetical protein